MSQPRKGRVRAHDFVRALQYACDGGPLAAAIGVEAYSAGQKRAEVGDTLAMRRLKEGRSDLHAMLSVDGEARPLGPHIGSREAGKLATGRGVAAQGGGDILEALSANIAEEEGCTFERRYSFERQHQRQGNVHHWLIFTERKSEG